MVALVRLVQPLKEPLPKVLTFRMTASSKEVQSAQTSYSMLVTLAGNVMFLNEEQPLNTLNVDNQLLKH